MHLLRCVLHFLAIITLLGVVEASNGQSSEPDRLLDPSHAAKEPSVEAVDLSNAAAELTISPAAEYALPDREFPNAVVVDLPHRRAYAATEFVAINVFSLLAAAWIEGLALIGVVATLWWMRRVARRPQQPGQPYCRRCNYLLTNLQADVCPECGSTITGSGTMLGRRRWPRLTVAGILFIGALALYGISFRRAPRLIWPDSWPAWWSRSLDRVAEANSKYQWLIQHSRVLSNLVAIDLDAGGAMQTIWTGTRSDADHINDLYLADDSSRLIVWHADSIEVRTLPEGNVTSRLDDSTLALPYPFRAIEQVELSGDGRTALLVGPGPKRIAMAVDLDSRRELWSINGLVDGDVSAVRLLHGPELNPFVVAADMSNTGVTDLTEWFIDGHEQPNRMRHFTTSAYALGPRLARNGLGPLIWASDIDHVEAWNLQTECVVKRIALPERSVLLFAWPGDVPRLIITMFDQDSRTWIVDTKAGRVLAQLNGAPLRTRSTRVLPDGKTLAVWGYNGDLSHKVLQLYDLSSIAPSPESEQ